MKITVLDGYTLNPGDLSWDALARLGELKVFDRIENHDDQSILEAIGDAEMILTNKTPISNLVLQQASSLKYIGVLATGYNVVDVYEATKQNIAVTNIPSYATEATAQLTFALILEMCNRVGDHQLSVQKGDWVKSIDFSYTVNSLMELKDKTLGIIGFGRIGQEVAKIAQAFGMQVVYYSRTPKPELQTEFCKMVSIDDLLNTSDIVSLHCPLNKQTQGLIDRKNIAKMKDGVLLVNTGRGPLLVEEDVKEALNSGKIAHAAMDVLSKEPMQASNPLMDAKNCMITPHIAWAAKETRQRLLKIATENIEHFLQGKQKNRIYE